MNTDLTTQVQTINKSDAEVLLNTFEPFSKLATEWAEKAKKITVTSADDVEGMKQARTARLALRDIRIQVENKRKELKEDSLRKGKAIDGVANVIKYVIEPLEDHLTKQEKFAEEKAKQEALIKKEERERQLAAFGVDVSFYDLGTMPDEVFSNLLESTKVAYEQKAEAEAKAERERLELEKAQRAEQERIKEENSQLKAEQEKREAELKVERDKAAAAELELEKQRQAVLAEQKRIAEEKRLAEEKEAKAKHDAAMAPDKEKLQSLAMAIDSIKMPELNSPEADAVLRQSITMLSKASEYIRTNAISL